MKIQIKKMKKRSFKRHFQLLELMVAVFILLICIAPTMRIFTNIYKSQQAIVRENQKNHLIHVIHAHITERLYKREISFEDIAQGKNIVLDPEIVELLEKSFFQLSEGKLEVRSHTPRGNDRPDRYLGTLKINLKDLLAKDDNLSDDQETASHTYDYNIYIDAKGNEASNDDQSEERDELEEEDDHDDDETDDDTITSPTGAQKAQDARIGQGRQR